MKLQYETITYNLQEAYESLGQLLEISKAKTLQDGEFFPRLEHIIMHLNFSYNAKFLDRETVGKLNRDESAKLWKTPQDFIIPEKQVKKPVF